MKQNQIFKILGILVIGINQTSAQEWYLLGNGGTTPGANFVGTTDAQPLNITTNSTGIGLAQPIYFNTNGAAQMVVDASGNVGIGTAAIPPVFQLDVDNEINVHQHSAMGSYKINGNTVLHTFNSPNNIFAGEQSGQNITNGNHNSCFGFSASSFLWNNGNSSNIYAGINSGNAGGFATSDNTFYGYFTGNSVNTAIGNTFLGRYSGNAN